MSKGDWRRPTNVSSDEYAINFALAMGPEKCRSADEYQAKRFPRCDPLCKTCARKWKEANRG
jgi:hypothetical protein